MSIGPAICEPWVGGSVPVRLVWRLLCLLAAPVSAAFAIHPLPLLLNGLTIALSLLTVT